jgi:hypothetical protein
LVVVVYEMLTGRHPFVASSGVELDRAIVAGKATPLAALVPDAPPGWQEFFNHALAREVTRRPRAPGDFISMLQSALE